MKKYYILIFTAFMLACSPKDNKNEEVAETENEVVAEDSGNEEEEVTMSAREMLIGEWRNLSMKVTMDDPDTVIDVPEGKWEEIMQMKPIRTTYKEDGTFVSEYRNLGDSVMLTMNGTWEINADSLTMVENGIPNTYHMIIKDDVASFSGYLDFDGDDAADDHYFGRQKKY